MSLRKPGGVYMLCAVMLDVGDRRWEMDVGCVAVGGAVWQGWQGCRVRFPAGEVMFDFFFILLFFFGFLVVICFASVFFSFPSFSFPSFSFLLMHHIAIFLIGSMTDLAARSGLTLWQELRFPPRLTHSWIKKNDRMAGCPLRAVPSEIILGGHETDRAVCSAAIPPLPTRV
jgi:hypothetical protein